MTDKEIKSKVQAYKIAVSNIQYEGSLVWSRFGVLAGANTLVAGALAIASNSSEFNTENFNILFWISLVGLIISGLWYHVTARGFSTLKFWTYSARELEEKLPTSFNLYRRGEDFKNNSEVIFKINDREKKLIRPWLVRNSLTTEDAGKIIIFIFILIYLVLLMKSLTPKQDKKRPFNINSVYCSKKYYMDYNLKFK